AVVRDRPSIGHITAAASAPEVGGDVPTESWREAPMTLVAPGTDEWQGSFIVSAIGWHEYEIVAWVDSFLTWRRELQLKAADGQDVSLELLEGSFIVREAAGRARTAAGEGDAE